MSQAIDSRPGHVLIAWLVLSMLHLGLSARHLSVPGLNYDEVVHAGFARDFVEGNPRGSHFPDTETISLFGRPFPWRTAFYEGGVKSQFLIPTFALFRPSPQALRLTTIAWGLLGLLFAMLWADRMLGWPIAMLCGPLMAFDPSLLFAARQDWGAVGPGLGLRCAGFYLMVVWWHSSRMWAAVAAGLAFGLLLYHRVDSALFLGIAGLAIIICQPRSVLLALRKRFWQVALGGTAIVIATAPMISSALHTLDAATEWSIRPALKSHAMWTTFDGSYMFRLMAVGGHFDRMFDTSGAPRGLFGIGFAVAIGICVLGLLRPQAARPLRPAIAFCLLASVIGLIGVFFMPAGERIQHVLHVAPFAHLVVASGVWIVASRARIAWVRGTVAILLVTTMMLPNLNVCRKTFQLIEDTGGRGWWSSALHSYISELDRLPERVPVCLDWGFNEQILFLGNGAEPYEPIWELSRAEQHDGHWVFHGSPENVYLVHEAQYDLFGYSTPFLDMVGSLDVDSVQIHRHTDRQNAVAFVTVRFVNAHRLTYLAGQFAIKWTN